MARRIDFEGKVAAVTGAGGGLGRALALALAARGARLAVSDIDGAAADQTATLIRAAGGEAQGYAVDVADEAAVRAHADAVHARFGVVHQLFNNAGIARQAAPIAEMPDERTDAVLGVNLRGMIRMTRHFMPHLLASQSGLLCNIASINGVLALGGAAPYSASKFGVIGFSDSVRIEMLTHARPVQVCLVLPGGIATGMATALPPGFDNKSPQEQAAILARRKAYGARVYRMQPEDAARKILNRAARGHSRVVVGHNAWTMDRLARMFPAQYPLVVAGWQRRMKRRR